MRSPSPASIPQTARGALLEIGPIAGVVLIAFFVIGMAMPVLPLHLHQRLGMSPLVIGLVAGSQFMASLVSRLWAGRLADQRGPKQAVVTGLCAAMFGGGCYLLSLSVIDARGWSAALLLVGRTLSGGGESLIITGSMLWGLGRVAPTRSAQAIAWVGMSMFAGLALGAPVGSELYARFDFEGVAIASALVPLASLAMILPVRSLAPVHAKRAPVARVLRAVMMPGVGFAMSGITFGAITSFLTLHFELRHWTHGAQAFTIFAVALVATRVVAGHLPDRFGGARVALCSLVVQATGLALIGLAGTATMAIIGAAVTGAGFSLVFPSLGLEAVRRVAPANRGTAMGAYNMFLDLTLGLGSPALGWLANGAGVQAVFDASALAALCAMPIAFVLSRVPRGSPAKAASVPEFLDCKSPGRG